MQILKILLLMFVVLLSDNINCWNKYSFISNSFAAEFKGDKYRPSDEASPPKCTLASYILAGFGVVVFAHLLSYGMPGPAGAAAVATTAALVTGFIMSNMIYFACSYAFVRHPVLRFPEGEYKTCQNFDETPINEQNPNTSGVRFCKGANYIKENGYQWPKNKAPNGNYIEFCHREAAGGLNSAVMDPREVETSTETELYYKKSIGGGIECRILKEGQTQVVHGITYRAFYSGDKICVEAYGFGDMPWLQRPEIGCHLRAPFPPAPMCAQSVPRMDDDGLVIISYDNSRCFKCYVADSCYGDAGIYSHAPFVVTSAVVNCLSETLSKLLVGCNSGVGEGFLDVAKKALKRSVLVVLTLAVVLFGVKLLIGAITEMKEVFLFLLKMTFVIYLTIGNGMTQYYELIIAISNGLSTVVFQAGGNPTVCDYKANEYTYPVIQTNATLNSDESDWYREIIQSNVFHDAESIANARDKLSSVIPEDKYTAFISKLEYKNFSNLLLWDQLDCRMGFYLGQSVFSEGVAIGVGSIIFWPLGLFLSGQIVFAIVIIVLVIMLILIVIWVVHIYALSLILLTIIILFAPLFVPMVLFQATKGFFDGWLREVIAYSLYPVVIFAFLGLLFSIFDSIYFDDLKFRREKSNVSNSFRSIYNFVLENDAGCDNKYTNLACIVSKSNFITKPLLFGINATAPDVWGNTAMVWKNFALMVLIAFLFHHFLTIIGALAGELVGSFRADLSRAVKSPLDMAKSLASGAKGGVDKIKDALNKKGGGGDGKDGKDGKDDGGGKSREGVKGGSEGGAK